MTTEIKTYHAEFKRLKGKRQIEGHCSIFGNVDTYGDIVEPGFFAESIAKRKSVVSFFNHEWAYNPAASPIGHTSHLAEDSVGLAFTIDVAETPKGDETLSLVDHGTVKQSSFGFNTEESERIPRGEPGKRRLIKGDIFEVSPVVWGANELATANLVKARAFFGEAKAGLSNLARALDLLATAQEYVRRAIELSMMDPGDWDPDVDATEETIAAFNAELERFRDYILEA